MDKKAYSFKSSATYRAGGHFKEKQASRASQKIMVDDEGGDFQASFPDIFADYQNPPLTGDINMGNKAWGNWQHARMTWWQCQLNFAVWCATAGCGVSADDHIQAKDPLLASLYRFHVYYATRRLLVELKVALPEDQSHSWYQNAYDARAYKRLCNEFGASPDTDWRQKLDHGCQGLGSWSTYMERRAPTGMRTTPMTPSSNRWTPSAITGIYQGRGRCSFPINQKASRKRVWSASTTRSGHMCGLSWERKPRHARTFSRPIRGSKAVPSQRRRCNCFSSRHPQQHRSISKDAPVCLNPSGLRLRVRALPRPERHDPPPGQCPGLQQRNRDRWI